MAGFNLFVIFVIAVFTFLLITVPIAAKQNAQMIAACEAKNGTLVDDICVVGGVSVRD